MINCGKRLHDKMFFEPEKKKMQITDWMKYRINDECSIWEKKLMEINERTENGTL